MMHLESPKLIKSNLGVILKLLLAIVILFSFSPAPVWAQEPDVEPQIVTAVAEDQCGGDVWIYTITVWNVGAAGGEAYAQAVFDSQVCYNDRLMDHDPAYGTFSGGPNGIATVEMCVETYDCFVMNYQFVDGQQILYEGVDSGFVIQNPEAFDGWRTEPITSEYIYKTYGIQVEDSFGDDQWEQKSWSDQELILLNDVLKELPPGLLSKMAVSRIIRNKVYIDKDGNQDPDTFGIYHPCGSPPEKDCTSSTGTIRIFDQATQPFDFQNDPDGYKEFKATILHELIHALQYKKDEYSIYKNAYSSPIVQNYMDATRPITNINDPGFVGNNGWTFGRHPPGWPFPSWKLFDTQGNTSPTNYGGTNPLEDMSESVMMYVYEPQKLKGSSLQRYNFIRDQIFEGVEYENGTQKKP
jgi:hypothetical protein